MLAQQVVYVTWIQVRLRDSDARCLEILLFKNNTKVESSLCIAIQGPMNEDKPNVKYQWREPNVDHNSMKVIRWNSNNQISLCYPAQNTVFNISDSSLIIRSVRQACVGNCTLLMVWPGIVISPQTDLSSFS